MRYAFVCLTILVIWLAIILMAFSIRHSNGVLALYYSALIMTVGLFWIGFRAK